MKVMNLLICNNKFIPFSPGMHGETHILTVKDDKLQIDDIFYNKNSHRSLVKESYIHEYLEKYDIVFIQFLYKPIAYSYRLYTFIRALSKCHTRIVYIETCTSKKAIYNSAFYPQILGLSKFIITSNKFQCDIFNDHIFHEEFIDYSHFMPYVEKSLNYNNETNSIVEFGPLDIKKHTHLYKCINYLTENKLIDKFSYVNINNRQYVSEELKYFDSKPNIVREYTKNVYNKLISTNYSTYLSLVSRANIDYELVIKSLFTLPIFEHGIATFNPHFKNNNLFRVPSIFLTYDYDEPIHSTNKILRRMANYAENNDLYIRDRTKIIKIFDEMHVRKTDTLYKNILSYPTNTADIGPYVPNPKNRTLSECNIKYEDFI